jgi:hypothetical protein
MLPDFLGSRKRRLALWLIARNDSRAIPSSKPACATASRGAGHDTAQGATGCNRASVVEIELSVAEELTQQNGFLHAGALLAALDSACG